MAKLVKLVNSVSCACVTTLTRRGPPQMIATVARCSRSVALPLTSGQVGMVTSLVRCHRMVGPKRTSRPVAPMYYVATLMFARCSVLRRLCWRDRQLSAVASSAFRHHGLHSRSPATYLWCQGLLWEVQRRGWRIIAGFTKGRTGQWWCTVVMVAGGTATTVCRCVVVQGMHWARPRHYAHQQSSTIDMHAGTTPVPPD